MKRFFTKTGIWLLAGAAVIAVVLCVISALGSGTSLLHNALGVIASPFRSAGSAVVEWVGGIGDHFASIEELQAENDCAVDCYGNLVGVVTEVGLNWCRLTTILDTGSQLGAMVFRTEETAIAAGDLSLMTEGRLKLSYLPDSSTLIKGDLVVTSGLGGYYPSGLPIGSVEEVRTDDGGLARYAVLTPRCDPDALTDLYIITDFDVVE